MSKESWQEAAEFLEQLVTGPASEQLKLAKDLGLTSIDDKTPTAVALARLNRELQKPLQLATPKPVSPPSLELLYQLEDQLGLPRTAAADLPDQSEVSAWIHVRYDQRTIRGLRDLQPRPGDILSLIMDPDVQMEVSSVGKDGQIYFRGGLGRRARPHQVQLSARLGAPDYDIKKYAGEQATAKARQDLDTGYARMGELSEFRIQGGPTSEALVAFEEALSTATDERPMQQVLEKFPELLAQLMLGHHGVFVIPQKSLGAEYVPDFLVGGVTSLGFRWLLVELESPAADIVIRDGQGVKQVRKGVAQIESWREWLSENLDYARKPKAALGLGLPGIRTDSEGLVLVSRENFTTRGNVMRERSRATVDVEIRTYDWVARMTEERLAGRESYRFGLPSDNLLDGIF
ncbi:Shedu anti-phage system protein SduA domain-containing protein [Actinoplanes sp. CA-142083]|uniref:Shedu anti-phage system protein SduA domain-containing protein n=1 Tax=Actinoplanes sp. CA-142083 TaxID=3239903 RepID=UPI003D94D859